MSTPQQFAPGTYKFMVQSAEQAVSLSRRGPALQQALQA